MIRYSYSVADLVDAVDPGESITAAYTKEITPRAIIFNIIKLENLFIYS